MVLNFVYSSKPTLTWGSFAIKLPYLKVTGLSLSKPQKVILVSVTIGIGAIAFLSRYLKRSKRIRASVVSKNDAEMLNRRLNTGLRSPNGDVLLGFQITSQFPSRYRTRSTSVNSERYSTSESVDLQSPSSPQQLRNLGVESLEKAIDYWEDALAAFQTNSGVAALLATEETEFCRSLERVLRAAYVLREHLFSHQHSDEIQPDAATLVGNATLYSRSSYSLAASDADSFVSAQGEIADLDDFEFAEYDESLPRLYQGSMKQMDEHGIPCRVLRTQLVSCQNDIEYLCKLHCIRLACQGLFHIDEIKEWFIREGRSLLCQLLTLAEKDDEVSQVTVAYDAMIEFVEDGSQRYKMAEELEFRGVKSLTFFDVVLDFILMDAFEDITDPPSTVLTVINNRWLSDGVKERAIRNAVWLILKTKRRKLRYPDGFMSHFYALMEHLSPVLAWGFLGPESNLKRTCFFFKDQVEGLLADMFSFEQVRYTTVEDMVSDLWMLAKRRRDAITHQIQSLPHN